MSDIDSHVEKIRDSNEIKELVKNDTFQKILKLLALRINSLDTVRGISLEDNFKKIALNQLGRKLAIETIELWLDDILGLVNFAEFAEEQVEEEDNIIKRLID